MSPIRLNGSTSGYSQIDAPAVAGDQLFTLPGTGGTLDRLNRAGNILQVVQTVKSDTFSSSTVGSYVAVTGLSATITPASANNKILVIAEVTFDTQNNYPLYFHLYRGGNKITPNGSSTGETPNNSYSAMKQPADTRAWIDQQTLIYLDSPSSTAAQTYQVYAAKPALAISNLIINPYGSSNILLIEVAG
jgi:hypothetical protein